MKAGLIFSVLAVIAIVVLTSFSTGPGEWIGIAPVVHNLPDSVAGIALYVCPVADNVFDSMSEFLLQFRTQLLMVFIGLALFLMASFGWAFYQNLIKDKFEQTPWNFSVGFARVLFWGTVIVTVLMYSPNHYKKVGVRGSDSAFILCESNTPGSRPVRSDAVVPWRKMPVKQTEIEV
jgi:hypothetical protein